LYEHTIILDKIPYFCFSNYNAMFDFIQNVHWAYWLISFSLMAVFLMAQHTKGNLKLEPEEVERLLKRLEDPTLTTKERNKIEQKLKTHQKADGKRWSKYSKNRKKPKKNDKN
jgi:hypothetical protein